jgi:hypothetical protein
MGILVYVKLSMPGSLEGDRRSGEIKGSMLSAASHVAVDPQYEKDYP